LKKQGKILDAEAELKKAVEFGPDSIWANEANDALTSMESVGGYCVEIFYMLFCGAYTEA
jgi:hypothetical protein